LFLSHRSQSNIHIFLYKIDIYINVYTTSLGDDLNSCSIETTHPKRSFAQGLKFRRSALTEPSSTLSFPDTTNVKEEKTITHSLPSKADAERFMQSMTNKEQAKVSDLHTSLTQVGEKLDTCTTCVYVLERIKMGYQYMLPSICVELYSLSTDATTFQQCHEVLAGLSVWGNNIRSWFQEGCYKAEPYGAMEKITPCPSHVICSQMQSLTKKDFCVKPEADFQGKGGS